MKQEFAVIIKVQAENCRDAVELAAERLAHGGEPDAVLTGYITFPDPEIDGAEVTI